MEIDELHYRIVCQLEDLHGDTSMWRDRDGLTARFEQLLAGIEASFDAEAMYFEKFGYEQGREHTAEHGALMNQLRRLGQALDESLPLRTRADFEAMRRALVDHITEGPDREFGEFIRKNGRARFLRASC